LIKDIAAKPVKKEESVEKGHESQRSKKDKIEIKKFKISDS